MLLAVGIIATVESSPQFWIAKDLVGFIDSCHLLLRLLLGHALCGALVWMKLLGHGSVLPFNGAFVCVIGDVENFVVIFRLRASERYLCLLEEFRNLLS